MPAAGSGWDFLNLNFLQLQLFNSRIPRHKLSAQWPRATAKAKGEKQYPEPRAKSILILTLLDEGEKRLQRSHWQRNGKGNGKVKDKAKASLSVPAQSPGLLTSKLELKTPTQT